MICSEIRAHRLILGAASGYFKGLLNFDESTKKITDVIVLKEANAAAVKMLIEFLYTDKMHFKSRHFSMKDVFMTADYLLLDSALMHFNRYAVIELTKEDAVGLLSIIEKLEPRMKEKVVKYIILNVDHLKRELSGRPVKELKYIVGQAIKIYSNMSVSFQI